MAKPSAKQGCVAKRTFDPTRLHAAILKALPELDGDLAEASRLSRQKVDAMLGKRDAETFASLYLRNQVSKRFLAGKIPPNVRVENAIRMFLDSEEKCANTNARLVDGWSRVWEESLRADLIHTRSLIRRTLGAFPWETFPRSCAFSNGATTEFVRSRAFIQNKWQTGRHITARALPYALAFLQWSTGVVFPATGLGSFEIVEENMVFTVPKNYERDRIAAKEPTLNVFFQKGIGSLIRNRLQSVGLLHREAAERHASMAQLASRLGHLATIDLSAASDSVSLALCELLLPDDWLQVILDLRSPRGTLPNGKTITYEKVSSMGNGFTFELETLLFWALSSVVCGMDAEVSCYGDDIIVPTEHADRVVRLLEFCGFSTNVEKTFTTGFFRESCGGHFFDGHDVKPFYIERLPTCAAEVIELHNQIVTYMTRCPLGNEWDEVITEARRLVPRSFWGPYGLPGCLWSAWDMARPTMKRHRKGWRFDTQQPPSWRVSVWRKVAPEQRHDYLEGGLLQALWLTKDRQPAPLNVRPPVRENRYVVREIARREAENDNLGLSAADIAFGQSARWCVKTEYVSVYASWTDPPVMADLRARGAYA